MDEQIDVKALREGLRLTQEQLADFLGLDRSSVSRMESGQRPRGPTLVLLRKLRGGEITVPRDFAGEPEQRSPRSEHDAL